MLVSASYQNYKIKHLPPRQEGETSGYHLNDILFWSLGGIAFIYFSFFIF